MSVMWVGKVTVAGAALLAQWAQGTETLYITRAGAGSGIVDESLLEQQTMLASAVPNAVQIVSKKTVESGVRYKLQILPSTTQVTVKQIGIFGKLGASGTETLIAIYQYMDGTVIPDAESMPDFIYVLHVVLTMSNDGNLTVNTDTTSVVAYGDLEEVLAPLVARNEIFRLAVNVAVSQWQEVTGGYGMTISDERIVADDLIIVTDFDDTGITSEIDVDTGAGSLTLFSATAPTVAVAFTAVFVPTTA